MHSRFHTSLLLPASVAGLLVLAGCSAPAPAAPAPSVAAADGETITGSDYTFRVPDGWGIPDAQIDGFDPDSHAMDLDDIDDGFSDNVNVLVGPGEASPDEIEDQGVGELEGVGGSDIAVRPRITIAGVESAHLTGTLAASGVEYVIDQYYISHENQMRIVTFSFSADETQDDREALAKSVLASWAWE